MGIGIKFPSGIFWGTKDITDVNPLRECPVYNKHLVLATIFIVLLLLLGIEKIFQLPYSGGMDQWFGAWRMQVQPGP